MVENALKPLEPLLALACLKMFSGGAWGSFKIWEALALIGMRICSMGLERGLLWYQAQTDSDRHIKAYWQSLFFAASIAAIILAILSGLDAMQYGLLPEPIFTGFIPGLYALGMLGQAWQQISLQFLVSKGVLRYTTISKIIALPIGTYGGALCFGMAGLGPISLPLGFALGGIFGMLTSLYGVANRVEGLWRNFSLIPVPPLKMLRFSSTISLSEIFMAMAARLDLFLLSKFSGMVAIEVYTTIMTMSNTLRTVRQSFDNIMLSMFSKIAAQKEPRDPTIESGNPTMVDTYHLAVSNVLRIHWPLLVVMLAYGNLLLDWLVPGNTSFWALPIGLLLVFIATPFSFCLQWQIALGRSWMMPLGQVGFVSTNAGLNFLLIPIHGIAGGIFAGGMAQIAGGVPATIACLYSNGSRLISRNFALYVKTGWPYALWLLAHYLASHWLGLITMIVLDAILFALVSYHLFWQKRNRDHG